MLFNTRIIIINIVRIIIINIGLRDWHKFGLRPAWWSHNIFSHEMPMRKRNFVW